MTSRDFWTLISSIEGDPSDEDRSELAPMVLSLSRRSPDEIQGFFDRLSLLVYALDTRAHYRAFALKSFPFVGSGRADDFLYARLSVVAQGERHYLSILEHPWRMPGSWTAWNEDLLYAADLAHLARTGQTFGREGPVNFESFSNEEGWR